MTRGWHTGRALTATAALLVFLAGCGEPEEPEADGPATSGQEGGAHPDAIWFEVLGVTQEARGTGDIAVAQAPGQLEPLWAEHRFEGAAPPVEFGEQVVVVLTRAEDACPDDLVEVRLVDAVIDFTWLPPPGACNQPLIATGYAIALHRADLPSRVTVRLRELHDDVENVLELPPYEGPPAPVPSPPPRQMSQAEVDAVFAGHAVRRCDEMPDYRTTPVVDGPLSTDADIAEIQRRRAGFALPSDEATARALRDDAGANTAMGFPMTEAEFDELMSRNRMEFTGRLNTEYLADHAGTFGFSFLDQAAGGVVVLGFTDDLEGHRQRLAELFPDVPFRVIEAPATRADVKEAQKALRGPFPHGQRPRILHSGGGSGHLEIGVRDPGREDLDVIAAVINPALACVKPVLSGLPRG